MEDLINNNSVKSDFIKFLTTKIPELQGFDKSNQQEISAAIKQFSLKEMVKYLFEKYKQKDTMKLTFHIIAKTLPEYSYVSTFTHGGAYAKVIMERLNDNSDIENELIRILEIGLSTTCVSKDNVFMTFEIDKSFGPYLNELQRIRSKSQ